MSEKDSLAREVLLRRTYKSISSRQARTERRALIAIIIAIMSAISTIAFNAYTILNKTP